MADYAAIIEAIDAAITAWAGKPVALAESGRSVTYRSLNEPLDARRYYAKLAITAANKKPFKISHFKAGGARS